MTSSLRSQHARGGTTDNAAVGPPTPSPTLPSTPSTPATPSSKKFSQTLPRPVVSANMRRPSLPSLSTASSTPALKTNRSNSSAHLLPPQTKPRSITLPTGSSSSGILSPKAGSTTTNTGMRSSPRATSPVSLRHDAFPSLIARPSSSMASPRVVSPSSGRFGSNSSNNNSNNSSSSSSSSKHNRSQSGHQSTSRPTQLDITAARRPSLSPRIGGGLSTKFVECPKTTSSPRLGQLADGRFNSENTGVSQRNANAHTIGPQSPSGIPSLSSAIAKSKLQGNLRSPIALRASSTLGTGVVGLSSGTNVPTPLTSSIATTTLTRADAQTQEGVATATTCTNLSSPLTTATDASHESVTQQSSQHPASSLASRERAASATATRTTKSATIKPPSIVTKPNPLKTSPAPLNGHPTPASSSFSSLPTASTNGRSSLPPVALARQSAGASHHQPIDPATPLSNPSPSSATSVHPYSSSSTDMMSTSPPSTTSSPPLCSLSSSRSKNRLHAGVDSACFMTRSNSAESITTTSPLSSSYSPTASIYPHATTPPPMSTTTTINNTVQDHDLFTLPGAHSSSIATAAATPWQNSSVHLRRRSSTTCLGGDSPRLITPTAAEAAPFAALSATASGMVKCNCPPPLELPEYAKQEMRREEEEHRKRECDLYAKIIELQIEVENLKGEKETLTRVVGRRDRTLESLQRQLEALEHICRENDIEVNVGQTSSEVVESWNAKESDEVYQRILFTMQDMLRTGSKCLENHRPLGLLAGSATIAAGGGGQERHSMHHSQSSFNAKAAAAVAYLNDHNQPLQQEDTCSSDEAAPRRALDGDDSRRRVLLAMGETVDVLPKKSKDGHDSSGNSKGNNNDDDEEDLLDEDDEGEESEFEELGEDMLKFAELQSDIMPIPSKMFPSPNMSSYISSRGPLTPDVVRTPMTSVGDQHYQHHQHPYAPWSREGPVHSRQSTASNLVDDYFAMSTPSSAQAPEFFASPVPLVPAGASTAVSTAASSFVSRVPPPSRPLPSPPQPHQQPLTGLGIVMNTRSMSQCPTRMPPPPPLASPYSQQQQQLPPTLKHKPVMNRSYSFNSVATPTSANHRLSTASSIYSTTSTTSMSGSICGGHRVLPPPQLPLPPIPKDSVPVSFREHTKKQLLEPLTFYTQQPRSKQQFQKWSSSTLGHGRTLSHGFVIEQFDRFLRRKKVTHQWTRELFNGGHHRRGSV
ncbi:hypothetical protein BGW42_008528 [Actinomortierella wolfii]|nr:hypothetical protein BGW42_008528 [Actinomortierella wolfii]